MTLTPGELKIIADNLQKQLEISERNEAERLQQWIDAHDRVHRLEGIAIDRARQVVDARLEEMNLFRRQLEHERAEFVNHDALDAAVAVLQVQLNTIKETQGDSREKTGVLDGKMIVLLLLGAALASGLVSILVKLVTT